MGVVSVGVDVEVVGDWRTDGSFGELGRGGVGWAGDHLSEIVEVAVVMR